MAAETRFSGVGELIGRSLGGFLAIKTSLGYLGICLANPLDSIISPGCAFTENQVL